MTKARILTAQKKKTHLDFFVLYAFGFLFSDNLFSSFCIWSADKGI